VLGLGSPIRPRRAVASQIPIFARRRLGGENSPTLAQPRPDGGETERYRAKSAYSGAPDTIRTCDLCLRRQGLLERRAPPQKSSRSIGALFWWLRYSGFSYSRAAKTSIAPHSSRGEAKIFALFSVSIVQIISLTVGPNGRWQGFAAWAVVWTFNVSDAGTRRVFSIEDRMDLGRPEDVGIGRHRSDARSEPRNPPTGSHGRRSALRWSQSANLSKALLGSKCTLCLNGSRQPIDITTNATALRAHHRHKSLMRKCFRDISTPALLPLCSANPPCFDLARVGPTLCSFGRRIFI
jgi:hypothetical protein